MSKEEPLIDLIRVWREIAVRGLDKVEENKVKVLILKVDSKKAFDSVNWKFLDLIMTKMGFGEKWKGWIKECISIASISVLVNGLPTRQFKLMRSLRQGCSLSPFLFNMVVKALSCKLNVTTLPRSLPTSETSERSHQVPNKPSKISETFIKYALMYVYD
ncbi:Uncharacterized protein TCM_023886 [Theobroma cacao]|uniref:Reverse transcriptase domain-containing protein n=1 Tax=Theobroma cacao TaxID=3641 RepID=A0A061EUL9_THECC|nr:Uncharacterized protein TCM_023886 [Theobroma cacao]